MKIFFLLFLLVSYIVFMSSKHPHPELKYLTFHGITYQIRVVNGFTNNSSLPLVIWCVSSSSSDDDIGGRALQEGDDYTWDTRLSIWSPTPAYSCTMKWDRIRKKFEAFQVPRCSSSGSSLIRKCSWLVKEDGFYFSNDECNWVKDFSWRP
ncbi:putative plant self-incompatibility S1 [Helianthus debilis subsp. tardiflorus]